MTVWSREKVTPRKACPVDAFAIGRFSVLYFRHACVLSCFSHVQLFATPWTVSCQPPLLCPPLGDLPDPGIEVASPAFPLLQVDSLLLSHRGSSSNTYHPPQWDYKPHQDFCSPWHHGFDGRESEWTSGVADGPGGLVCCCSWGCRVHTTEQLNWTELMRSYFNFLMELFLTLQIAIRLLF